MNVPAFVVSKKNNNELINIVLNAAAYSMDILLNLNPCFETIKLKPKFIFGSSFCIIMNKYFFI